jgi:hypothetical protein
MNTKITAAVSVVVGAAVIVALTLWVASFTLFAGAAGVGMSTTTLTLLQAKPKLEQVDTVVKQGFLTFFEAGLTTTSGADGGVLSGSILKVDVSEDLKEFEVRQRTLTFDTPDGQIQAAGLSNYPLTERELAKVEPHVIAVVGGTGKYLGAMGEVKTTRLADGSYEHVFTFVTR